LNRSTAPPDLEALLRRANAAADSILPRAQRLMSRISSLAGSAVGDMPKFRGDFTQDGLLSYIENLEEWSKTPWRGRSRQILQDCGINCDGIQVEVLDDSEGVSKTVAAIAVLHQSANPALAPLIDAGLRRSR
jgi:hypothetical protein